MIELTVKEHLEKKLKIPILFEHKEKDPKKFILIEKTGSSSRNHLNSVTFIFQSYDESMYKTAALNEALKSAVESLIEIDDIASVKLNSDYNFTDEETKRYRYQAVYDIKY